MDRDLQVTAAGKSTGNSNKSTAKNSDENSNQSTDPRNKATAPIVQVTGPKTGNPSNTSRNPEKATSHSIENSNHSVNLSGGAASRAYEFKQQVQAKATSENTTTHKDDGERSGKDKRSSLAPGVVLPNATGNNHPTGPKNHDSCADSKEGSAMANPTNGLQKRNQSMAPKSQPK